MFDIIKKTMLAGVGLALKTKDEVEDLARDLISKTDLSENDGEKFIDDLLKRYDEAKEKLEERLGKSVQGILKKANVATKDEVDELRKEIMALKKDLKE